MERREKEHISFLFGIQQNYDFELCNQNFDTNEFDSLENPISNPKHWQFSRDLGSPEFKPRSNLSIL